MRARHPVGLALLGASVGLAVVSMLQTAPHAWLGRPLLLLAEGVAAWVVVGLIVGWSARPAAPPLVQLRSVRRTLQARLIERRAALGEGTPVVGMLEDALRRIDDQLLPTLEQVVARHAVLGAQLERYRRGDLPPPDPALFGRLLLLRRQQDEAIVACVRQAANADAALLALAHEVDDGASVDAALDESRRWIDRVVAAHDALSATLRADPYAELAAP